MATDHTHGNRIGGRYWPLVSASCMRELDRYTIEELGIPGELLMETAGRAVAEVALAERSAGGTISVICGAGNNGGDGFVAARHLHQRGVPVQVYLAGASDALRGDAAAHWKRARATGVPLLEDLARLPEGGLIIDALLGTGLTRPVEGNFAALIGRMREASRHSTVLAVDLPSGLDADTGQELGVAVSAHGTVTLGLPKIGLALEPGRSLAGRVWVARIGIADRTPEMEPTVFQWTDRGAGSQLPARPAAGHKGSFGHVLIVAASEGKTGAAALAAEGAARAGSGLVTVACPAGLNDILEVKCTEAMTVPVADTPGRGLDLTAEDSILSLGHERDAVAVGPGIGRAEESLGLVRAVAKRLEKPLVIDADGLYAFRESVAPLRSRSAPTVLTPHPGEAGRLLGISNQAVNRDRIGVALELARASGCVVVLKGAATVIASPAGATHVNPSGGPALGTGGTGDVLTGIVTAYLAQGMPAHEASVLATYVHGKAADALSEQMGPAGLLAGDLARALPAAAQVLRQVEDRDPGGFLLPFPQS